MNNTNLNSIFIDRKFPSFYKNPGWETIYTEPVKSIEVINKQNVVVTKRLESGFIPLDVEAAIILYQEKGFLKNLFSKNKINLWQNQQLYLVCKGTEIVSPAQTLYPFFSGNVIHENRFPENMDMGVVPKDFRIDTKNFFYLAYKI